MPSRLASLAAGLSLARRLYEFLQLGIGFVKDPVWLGNVS